LCNNLWRPFGDVNDKGEIRLDHTL